MTLDPDGADSLQQWFWIRCGKILFSISDLVRLQVAQKPPGVLQLAKTSNLIRILVCAQHRSSQCTIPLTKQLNWICHLIHCPQSAQRGGDQQTLIIWLTILTDLKCRHPVPRNNLIECCPLIDPEISRASLVDTDHCSAKDRAKWQEL